jgi:F0F1-type ATP synthase delta subunit
MMKKQIQTTSLSSIELAKMPEDTFQVTVAYLKSQLRKSAERDALEVEVYAARDLSPSEKSSLEKRLTRASTDSTVYVILSKPSELMKIENR